jgi:regulator of sirC expression with transglutaminase-like and TPR domain
MPYALHLSARVTQVAADLERALNGPGSDLLPAALAIARLEYPSLETRPYVEAIEQMGSNLALRLRGVTGGPAAVIAAVNEYLYDEEGFRGNRDTYDDPRNSFLNEVIDRRTGIPISLAIVYMEVAARAGFPVTGINFPGHFLLRADSMIPGENLIIDPFHGGALLSEFDCRQMLRHHVGDEAAFDSSLLAPATRHDILVRMLVNLKRLYVRMRSFPQARFVSTLLLNVDPSAVGELRDRGLLAYHLEDFSSALKDLEEYLRLAPHDTNSADQVDENDEDEDDDAHADAEESPSVINHVKALRRRVAGFN